MKEASSVQASDYTTHELSVPAYLPNAADCRRCADELASGLGELKGIIGANVDGSKSAVVVTYDSKAASPDMIERRARLAAASLGRRYGHESLRIADLDCPDCAAKLERAIAGTPGVLNAAMSFATATLQLEYDRTRTHRGEIVRRIERLGHHIQQDPARITVCRLNGLDCPDCAAKLEREVQGLNGVVKAHLNFGASTLTVEHFGDLDAVSEAIRHHNVEADFQESAMPAMATDRRKAGARLWLTAASGVLLLAGTIGGLIYPSAVWTVVLALAMASGGFFVARAGYYSLRSGMVDINFLMTLAVIGAGLIGEWTEGASVVFLFSLGNLLESYTMNRTRQSVRRLMQEVPKTARVRREGNEAQVPIEQVVVGDVVVVHAGERIAVDGRVLIGSSGVNQASVTGESIPAAKEPGDRVYAGTLNGEGTLEIEVTSGVTDSTIARVIRLVEEAQAQKAPSERMVDRFARYYTPAVIAAAASLAVLPPLVFGRDWHTWLYQGLALLVVSCPCALVISTPVSVVSALGSAARQGVLIKGGAHLEHLGTVAALAFDKTGTLTRGEPRVVQIIPFGQTSVSELLHVAVAVEAQSAHPLARAVVAFGESKGMAPVPADNVVTVPGQGLRALVDGREFAVGSRRLFSAEAVVAGESDLQRMQVAGLTPVLVGTPTQLIGIIGLSDTIRPGTRAVINALNALGLRHLVMLTGDNRSTAEAVADEAGLADVRSELLPEDKVKAVRSMVDEYGSAAMVGDGLNDAPALAAATVGIAMGGAGSDVALETADVALMSDDIGKLPFAIDLGRRTRVVIRQNIVFALLVKLVFLGLAMLGHLSLWLAVAGDMGSSLLVTFNGMRLMRAESHSARSSGNPGIPRSSSAE